MSNKLNSLEQLRLALLRAKGYTADQIAALADTLQGIISDINASLETCEAHVNSPHAPSDAEKNVIVSIKKNGAAVAPTNRIVDILVPTKTSELLNDQGFTTAEDINEAIALRKPLRAAVVELLPAVSEAEVDTIYYVRQNNGENGNQYKEYQLINGAFELIGNNKADLSSYATKTEVEKASDALVTSIFNDVTSSAEKYIGTANLAMFWSLVKPLIDAQGSSIHDLESRVELLEIATERITGNPFSVTFASLDGVNVSGVWNQNDSRIEF